MDKDFLYHLLPEVYRSDDLREGEQLRAFMRVLNSQFELLHADISQLYDDWFIETCRDDLVPFISDLVRGGLTESPMILDDVPRAFVANLMAYRRGKGTTNSLCGAIADTTRWPTQLIDFTRMSGYSMELVTVQDPSAIKTSASRHIVVAITNQALYIRVFDINGAIIIDDNYSDRGAYRKKVEDLYSKMTLAKAANLSEGELLLSLFDLLCANYGVSVCVSRIKSFDVVRAKPFKVKKGCYKFNPFGIDAALYGKHFLVGDAVELAKDYRFPNVIDSEKDKLNFFGGAESELYSVNDVGFGFVDEDGFDSSIDESEITFASLSDWVWPELGSDELSSLVIVDPSLGRFMISETYEGDADSLLVNYSYGFSASLGGGAYDRNLTNASSEECIWQAYVYAGAEPEDENSNTFSTLQAALNAFDNICGSGVICILDSNTYDLDNGAKINGAPEGYSEQPNGSRSIVIESKNGETPCIRGSISIIGCHPATNVTLSGLWIHGTITVMGSLKLRILHSTIRSQAAFVDSGINKDLSISYDSCDQIFLEIESSIMERVRLPQNNSQLFIRNSVVQSQEQKAIEVGSLVVDCVTIIGGMSVDQVKAVNSILLGEIGIQDTADSEISYSYIASEIEGLSQINCVDESCKLSFASEEYGHYRYVQITSTTLNTLTKGASNGEEMGVFNLLKQSSRLQRAHVVLEEFSPHGVKTSLEFM